ncbi:MAG: DUF2924 domain-containing protein [Pirellulales bacterium]|nr:DUF2924 domain-containing protein [Pirellulales bacterium]
MTLNVGKEVAALQRMTVRELRIRYTEAFGEETRAGNKAWLVKRITWRMQSLEEGDISQRARQRAAELANDADVRLSPPKPKPASVASTSSTKTATLVVKGDNRLPPPGTIITREYKGQSLQVKVLPKGFEYQGEVYKSLTAVAKAITGQHCSGYHFFRLGKEGKR